MRPGSLKWRSWEITYCDYEDEEISIDWPDGPEDYSMFDNSFFERHELEHFETILKDVLQLSSSTADECMQNIRNGWDEPLKGMLFALAPKWDRLNFIACDETDLHDLEDIQADYEQGVKWPPGFASLRMISVGSPTKLRHPHNQYNWSADEVTPLFLLPNIRILNLVSGYPNEDHDNLDFFLPERSSSVEELAFSCCGDFELHTWRRFVTAPKALKKINSVSLCTRSSEHGFFHFLAEQHRETLEHISLDDYPKELSLFAQFTKLKTLDSLPVAALLIEDQDKKIQACLPATLEKIRFSSRNWELHDSPSTQLNQVLKATADFVEDPRFPNLTEVCLGDLTYHVLTEKARELVKRRDPHREAAKRIQATGVDIHLQFWDDDRGVARNRQHRRLHRMGNYNLVDIETDPRSIDERDY